MFTFTIITICLGLTFANEEIGRLHNEDYLWWMKKWADFTDKMLNDEDMMAEYEESLVAAAREKPASYNWWWFDDVDPSPQMNCRQSPSPVNPTSAHAVRLADIRVVGALGDSISGGNGLGAKTLPQVALENRGESYGVGGDYSFEQQVVTIPNVLRKLGNNIEGAAVCYSGEDHVLARNNVAEPGATHSSLYNQANHLVSRIRGNPNINQEEDWKLITIWVGGNDLCRYCDDRDRFSPTSFAAGHQRALDVLHSNLNKTIVNVIAMFDITPLNNMSTGIVCHGLHVGFCHCAVNQTTKEELKDIHMGYYTELKKLIDSGRYDTRPDFTVVFQHHMRDLEPIVDENGDIDHSYFSPDCFHPSRKSHQGFAYMLWNVMLIPYQYKPVKYDVYENPYWFRCPTDEHPYIFTNLNSNVEWTPPTPPAGVKKRKTWSPWR